ncbi:noncompact myelin-associated protein isoform X1 [Lepus europaeus]|uniref:noncompact myelin-associated protein isoform X1 n=1 Tax=Lepus europaeus TaxID=9983 RepID=UPI002B482851|nr:noncompact myelin-associated protein isoform X1 [Lepus europaeus]
MTTATPLGDTTFFSLNMTTRGEDFLYKSSGAIVAAIVVVVIIIFTVVLILLKMYNRYEMPGALLLSGPPATSERTGTSACGRPSRTRGVREPPAKALSLPGSSSRSALPEKAHGDQALYPWRTAVF